MSFWDAGLAALPAYKSVCADLRAKRGAVSVIGLAHIHKAVFTAGLRQSLSRRVAVLTADEAEAARMTEDLRALGLRVEYLPAREITLRPTESASREYEQMRLGTLATLAEGNYDAVVACVEAAVQYTIPPDTLLSRTLELTAGSMLPVEDLPAALSAAGYERCAQIEGAGQFAVRGGIVDVYPADSTDPMRIELWGDTVDTIAAFDLLSQRRTESLEAVSIPPAAEIACDDPAALAAKLTALANAQRGKMAPTVKEHLLADADELRGGVQPASMDPYISLLYEKATLFD